MSLLPSYEAALFADLQKLLAAVPHDRIAVQWDVAVEFGLLEQATFATDAPDVSWITGALARCVDQVPRDVPVGAHLCYGDYGHKHFVEPASLATQVDVIHALGEKASRPVSFYSLTVPQDMSAPEYFAPLADLRVPDETELYLALVPYHPESQAPGTTAEQIRLVDEQLGAREWGICTECGMGRVERDDVLPMLDAYREILAGAVPAA
jgi:methionine synthase II (cobalamin-independent)